VRRADRHRVRYQRDLDPELPLDDFEARLDRCLQWMWHSFTERVLDHLGYRATPADDGDWLRLWWCPTGALTLVPIHAAGDHRTPGAAVIDRVVSSYPSRGGMILEDGSLTVTDLGGRAGRRRRVHGAGARWRAAGRRRGAGAAPRRPSVAGQVP
jgi:hypothetical protein